MKAVFIAYPYALKDYRRPVAAAAKDVVQLIYADDVLSNKHILEKITELMISSDLCLFDLTSWNANVALELGVAVGRNLNYRILINQVEHGDVFSDMKGWDQLRYTDYDDLQVKLNALFRHSATFSRPIIRPSQEDLSVQPYLHIDLHGAMSGTDGHFLEGFVRNAGDGIAHQPMLRLPGLDDVRLGGIMKQGEEIPLKIRYDEKPCFRQKLADPMASVEFGDRLGNLYRQEGPVTQALTNGGVILTYAINAFGLPYKITNRNIGVAASASTSGEIGAVERSTAQTTTNQRITRISFGSQASGLKETNFGAKSEPVDYTSIVDVFDTADDEALVGLIRQLPSCKSFTVVPVQEGAILSDVQFDVKTFGSAVNAIHVKTAGEVCLRFSAHGAHQLYDLFRTLGSTFLLAKYMHRRYKVNPRSRVFFAFNIFGEYYPNVLPTPAYEGAYDMDVSAVSFTSCTTDAVLACLRAGNSPRANRLEVAETIESFWEQHFSAIML